MKSKILITYLFIMFAFVMNASAEQNMELPDTGELIMEAKTYVSDYKAFEQEYESKKAAICIGTSYTALECIKKGSIEATRMFIMMTACYKKEYSQISEDEFNKYLGIGGLMTMIVTKGCNDLSYTSQLLGNYCRPNMVRLNSCMEQMVKGY